MIAKSPEEGTGVTDLPASLSGKARDLHAVGSASGTRSGECGAVEYIAAASTASKLNSQAFAHEIRSVEGYTKAML